MPTEDYRRGVEALGVASDLATGRMVDLTDVMSHLGPATSANIGIGERFVVFLDDLNVTAGEARPHMAGLVQLFRDFEEVLYSSSGNIENFRRDLEDTLRGQLAEFGSTEELDEFLRTSRYEARLEEIGERLGIASGEAVQAFVKRVRSVAQMTDDEKRTWIEGLIGNRADFQEALDDLTTEVANWEVAERQRQLRAEEEARRGRDRRRTAEERGRRDAVRAAQRHARDVRDTAQQLAQDARDHMMFMVEIRADARRRGDEEEQAALVRRLEQMDLAQVRELRMYRQFLHERAAVAREAEMGELLHLERFHGAQREVLEEHIQQMSSIWRQSNDREFADQDVVFAERISELSAGVKQAQWQLAEKDREVWKLWASDISTATDTFASVGRSLGGIMEEVTKQKGLVWWIEGLAQVAYGIAAGVELQWGKAAQHAAAATAFFYAASQAGKTGGKGSAGGSKNRDRRIERRRQTLEEAPDSRLRSPSGMTFMQYNDFRGAVLPGDRIGGTLTSLINRGARVRDGRTLGDNVIGRWRR
jgi:hypothetical protein